MRAGCISIRAAAAISNACCATAIFLPTFSPAPSGSETRLVERGITKYNLASGERRSPASRRIVAASSCRGRSRTICRSVSAPARCAPISACWRGCAPQTPMRSSCTSRTPTLSPDTGSARCRTARRGASPISSSRMARPIGCWPSADEVHTMTSLAGFEALLRGLRVVVYGRPFYAGWGLTTDLPAFDRGRRLTLDQLVAGALILYPRYLDPLTRLPCGPEILVERLEQPELWRAGPLVRMRRLQGLLSRRLARLRVNAAIGRCGRGRAACCAPARPTVTDLMRAPYRVDRNYRRVERARRGAGHILCRTGRRAGAGGAQSRAAGADRGRLPRRRRPRRERRDRCRRYAQRWRLGSENSTALIRSSC